MRFSTAIQSNKIRVLLGCLLHCLLWPHQWGITCSLPGNWRLFGTHYKLRVLYYLVYSKRFSYVILIVFIGRRLYRVCDNMFTSLLWFFIVFHWFHWSIHCTLKKGMAALWALVGRQFPWLGGVSRGGMLSSGRTSEEVSSEGDKLKPLS